MSREKIFERCPSLRDEWDFSKNTELDPEKVSPGSAKYAWWICKAGHSWRTQVRVRTSGSGCKECFAYEIIKNNPLTLSPELAKELDDPNHSPSQLSRSTAKKVWWKCADGHRWESSVASRYYQDVRCPYCSGRYPIAGKTDLATLRPDLVEQWDDSLDPTAFTVSSMQKIRWKCPKGHQWVTAIHYRHHSRTKGNGCPYCSHGRHSKTLVGVNDLATLHPEIAKELYSTHLTAQELREFSNKKLEWRCVEGHIWSAKVSDRVLGNGCRECTERHTSKIEKRLRSLVHSKNYLSGTILDDNHKLTVPWRKRKSMNVDIYCEWEGLPVIIEYDGAYWHDRDKSLSRDLDKTNALLSHNYIVIRIRENKLPLLGISHENLLQLNVDYSIGEENLEQAMDTIEEWLTAKE